MLKKLVSQMSSIPSLPEAYTEIVEELQSPNASIQIIGQIVSRDLGMTAKILQLVNSAFFGLRCHVSNPSQAASLLGVDTLKALVLSVHIFSQFDCANTQGLHLHTLWNHSATTGALAKSIAETVDCDGELRDHALMAGLLHDAGKMVLAVNLPERYREALALAHEGGLDACQAERQILANTHADVGAYLFGLWGLPDPIIEAVAFHHHPSRCSATGFTPLTAVHAANVIDHEQDPPWTGRDASPLDTEYLAQLGLADRLPAWRDLYTKIAQEEGAP